MKLSPLPPWYNTKFAYDLQYPPLEQGTSHLFAGLKRNEEPHKTSDKLERLHLALGVSRMWNDFRGLALSGFWIFWAAREMRNIISLRYKSRARRLTLIETRTWVRRETRWERVFALVFGIARAPLDLYVQCVICARWTPRWVPESSLDLPSGNWLPRPAKNPPAVAVAALEQSAMRDAKTIASHFHIFVSSAFATFFRYA